MTSNSGNTGAVTGWICGGFLLLQTIALTGGWQEARAETEAVQEVVAVEQADSKEPAAESAEVEAVDSGAPLVSGEETAAPLSRIEEVERLQLQLAAFEASDEEAVALFNAFRNQTRLRLLQLDEALDQSNAVTDPVTIDVETIKARYPGLEPDAYILPEHIVTLRQLLKDTLDVYAARNQMLDLIPGELRAAVVGTGPVGMQELRIERDLIIAELRYQSLRLPLALIQVKQMAGRAPVLLLWLFVQLGLAIFVFRWWRRWFPATLQNMRSSLLAIRPRTDEILTRVRGLWYISQVRIPIEWLLLWTFLFSLTAELNGLDFVSGVGLIIVRWLMLTWFAVQLLNAYVARGAGGMSGESAKLRLKSLRLIAGWLLLLGLGVDLSNDLVGNAAITTWIWRIFQLLVFPITFTLLSIWHMELYDRLAREIEPAIPREVYEKQKSLRRWIGSAKITGLLFTSWIRAVLVRRIERFGGVRSSAGQQLQSELAGKSDQERLPPETRKMLIEGHDTYSRYARNQRNALVARINAGVSGMVVAVGERGIGKNGFLRQVAEEHDHQTLFIRCEGNDALGSVRSFYEQLDLDMHTASIKEVHAKLEASDIRFILFYDMHLLLRPVIGGFDELRVLTDLFARIKLPLIWGLTVDKYAYQLIARYRAEYSLVDTIIKLPAWTDEQIADFIEKRSDQAGIQADFRKLKVPRQYMDTAQEDMEDRNRAGLYNMISAMSRGNPSIAIRLFADCLSMQEQGVAEVSLPQARDDRVFKEASITVLLILRVIAQVESVTLDDIASNLNMNKTLIESTLHTFEMRGWVEKDSEKYRLSWDWFRVIIQILGRQNLLAGTREVIT